jgi:hypothetical protein
MKTITEHNWKEELPVLLLDIFLKNKVNRYPLGQLKLRIRELIQFLIILVRKEERKRIFIPLNTIEYKIKKLRENKIKCDCPCNGPFCYDLIHPCKKQDEHYSPREDSLLESAKNYLEKVIQSLIKEDITNSK